MTIMVMMAIMIVNWDQVGVNTVAVFGVLAPIFWSIYRQRKNQHRQNQDKLDMLLEERDWLAPHDHAEYDDDRCDSDTALTVGNIRRRPTNGAPKKVR